MGSLTVCGRCDGYEFRYCSGRRRRHSATVSWTLPCVVVPLWTRIEETRFVGVGGFTCWMANLQLPLWVRRRVFPHSPSHSTCVRCVQFQLTNCRLSCNWGPVRRVCGRIPVDVLVCCVGLLCVCDSHDVRQYSCVVFLVSLLYHFDPPLNCVSRVSVREFSHAHFGYMSGDVLKNSWDSVKVHLRDD